MLDLGDNWDTACDASARDEVHVFQFALSVPPQHMEEAALMLSTHERERAESLRFAQLRDRSIAARAGLRCVLASCLHVLPSAVELLMDKHGKPFVPHASLQFNLSHAGDRAVIAVAHGRAVGVDLEVMRDLPDALEIAERFFAKGEVQGLKALRGTLELERAFFECWTRKEAFVKALGLGLSHPLDCFEVSFFPQSEMGLSGTDTERWSLQKIDVADGYIGALVAERLSAPVVITTHICRWQGTR